MDDDPRFVQDVNLFDNAEWEDILNELTKKYGPMPDYLYNAIFMKEHVSFTPDSNSLSETPASFTDEKPIPDDSSEDCGMVSPELHRRSPGVDSGCSVGFNDDDDDDEIKVDSPYRRMDSAIEKIRSEMTDLRLMTIALTKRFIYAFDIIEDIKYLNENSSSRESLSGSLNGSQEQLTPRTRRRKSHFKKFSRSVPLARGTCPDVINRQNRKLSEDIKLRLFEKQVEGLNGYRNIPSIDSHAKVNETTGKERLRRASDDSTAHFVNSAESTVLHRRSYSISYGQGNNDQWIENVQEIDRSSRNMEEFASMIRAQTTAFDKYLSLSDTLNDGTGLEVDSSKQKSAARESPIELDDVNLRVDEIVKPSEKSRANFVLEKDRESVYEFIFDQSFLGDDVAEEKSYPYVSASTPCSPTLFTSSRESPRTSWLHGEGRLSYNEKHENKSPQKTPNRTGRSRSLSFQSYEDDSPVVPEGKEESNRSQETTTKDSKKEKPKPKPLTRSLTFQEFTNMRKRKKASPKQDEIANVSPISPRYLQLIMMLEQENGTDL